ncbi:MAG TPA: hypothetical protein PLB90_06325 [Opitutaceae bacterium]|nr:hypothetical protein [Opitutaceae bacterium]
MTPSLRLLVLGGLLLTAACSRPPAAPPTAPARHEHHAPHGGTPVMLGAELYHLELVRDAADGRLRAYVLDGELENFIRIAAPAIELTATVDGQPRPLVLTAVANPATGESVGDTACFEGQADWLRTTPAFDAVLVHLEVRGTTFTAVAFNFPRGNDRD